MPDHQNRVELDFAVLANCNHSIIRYERVVLKAQIINSLVASNALYKLTYFRAFVASSPGFSFTKREFSVLKEILVWSSSHVPNFAK